MHPKTRVKNAEGTSIGQFEVIAPNPLMVPDTLNQAFGRRVIVAKDSVLSQPPLRIAILACERHDLILNL
jgi:hypothetical protein